MPNPTPATEPYRFATEAAALDELRRAAEMTDTRIAARVRALRVSMETLRDNLTRAIDDLNAAGPEHDHRAKLNTWWISQAEHAAALVREIEWRREGAEHYAWLAQALPVPAETGQPGPFCFNCAGLESGHDRGRCTLPETPEAKGNAWLPVQDEYAALPDEPSVFAKNAGRWARS
jgi:hypothetical protein